MAAHVKGGVVRSAVVSSATLCRAVALARLLNVTTVKTLMKNLALMVEVS